jgi:hypothetical protein
MTEPTNVTTPFPNLWSTSNRVKHSFKGQVTLMRTPMDVLTSRMGPNTSRSPLSNLKTIGDLVGRDFQKLLAIPRVGERTLVAWLDEAASWADEHTTAVNVISTIEPVLLNILECLGRDAMETVRELAMGSWTSPIHSKPGHSLQMKDMPYDMPETIIDVRAGIAVLDEITLGEDVIAAGDRNGKRIVRLKILRRAQESDEDLLARSKTRLCEDRIVARIDGTSFDVGIHAETKITQAYAIMTAKSVEASSFPEKRESTQTIQVPADSTSALEAMTSYEPREYGTSRQIMSIVSRSAIRRPSLFGRLKAYDNRTRHDAETIGLRWNKHDDSWWLDIQRATTEQLISMAGIWPTLSLRREDGTNIEFLRAKEASWLPDAVLRMHPILVRIIKMHDVSLQSLHLMPDEDYAGPFTWHGGTTAFNRRRVGARTTLHSLPATMPAIWITKKDGVLSCAMLQLGNRGAKLREKDGIASVRVPKDALCSVPAAGDDLGMLLDLDWLSGIRITSCEEDPYRKGESILTIDEEPMIVSIPYAAERPTSETEREEKAILYVRDLAKRVNEYGNGIISTHPCVISIRRHETDDHARADQVVDVMIPDSSTWSYVLRDNPIHMRSTSSKTWSFHCDNMDPGILARALKGVADGAVLKDLDDGVGTSDQDLGKDGIIRPDAYDDKGQDVSDVVSMDTTATLRADKKPGIGNGYDPTARSDRKIVTATPRSHFDEKKLLVVAALLIITLPIILGGILSRTGRKPSSER